MLKHTTNELANITAQTIKYLTNPSTIPPAIDEYILTNR